MVLGYDQIKAATSLHQSTLLMKNAIDIHLDGTPLPLFGNHNFLSVKTKWQTMTRIFVLFSNSKSTMSQFTRKCILPRTVCAKHTFSAFFKEISKHSTSCKYQQGNLYINRGCWKKINQFSPDYWKYIISEYAIVTIQFHIFDIHLHFHKIID